ncbi:aldo/keto reductase [Pseudoalteromonas sp. 2CM39R]|uniref:aldo/keto reductase n=1 Tax=Pseudoalteromonas sp. 2CM39R TaxID=2929856 RepID=UPI0020BDFF92|nr:aldo/keto reductase [Pseudoalteromonas sp. 2CM39R]MCK8127060.1 aldo/keto reductase [Pseudoalteromonas sp. 2CM39R]
MKLALGTVQFGLNYGVSNRSGKTKTDEVKRILKLAKSASLNTIDTAAAYGDAEAVLGNCAIDDFNIVSKVKPLPNSCNEEEWVHSCLEHTLSDLHLNAIYGLLLHNADDLKKYPSLLNVLYNLKADNKVAKVGLSVYSPNQISEPILEQIDLIQLPANIFDQRFLTADLLKKFKKNKVEVHTRSAFLQGLLLMSEGEWPEYFNPIKQSLEIFHHMAKRLDMTPLALAINYVVGIESIDKVVIGVNSEAQLEEILQALDSKLEPNVFFNELAIEDESFINPAKWQLS